MPSRSRCSRNRPIPIVRAVWPDGIIRTFSDQVGDEDVEIEDQEPELEEE